MKKPVVWFISIVSALLAYGGASWAWAEFGPEGQKEDATEQCIAGRIKMIPEWTLEEIMADCSEENGYTIK
ncbi:hypothetical protein ACFO6V_28025 [Promicromonospora alba]|uniref:TMhelix containing protein n=1 Tax=Promicromonospora alba TaxID=1616110 RepID=A0ABV9HPP3_9MICO